jgi:hypothetical protein
MFWDATSAKLNVLDGTVVFKGTGTMLTVKNGFGTPSALKTGSVASFDNEGPSGVAVNFFAASSNPANIYFGDATAPEQGAIRYNIDSGVTSNQSLGFTVNSAERLRITSGGNVGIGTTSPARPLHIANSTTPT